VVFGKGENGNFTRLYWGIRKRRFFYAGRKDTIKACIYVKDLAHFMLYQLEHCADNVELYNCAYNPAFTIEQIVETMKRITGLKRQVIKINGSLLVLIASIIQWLGGTKLGIHPDRVKKLMVSTNICGRKMAESGYKFRYTFEEAIRDWYKDNNNMYLE
jgi:nucleoside-diphosphate-sugar epimerase